MSANIAAVIQSQMLQTLLKALQSADQPLKAGEAVKATFVGWSATSDTETTAQGKAAENTPALREALIQVNGKALTMLIGASPERRALMQPGATLTLQVDKVAGETGPAQMRLLDISTARSGGSASANHSSVDADRAAPAAPARTEATAKEQIRSAAGPLVGAALARQNGLGALFADLEALVSAPVPLPAKVTEGAARVLAMRLDSSMLADKPEALKAAVTSSGLLHEAMLAKGASATAAADMKGTLIVLKQALREALGPIADIELPGIAARATDPADSAVLRRSAEASAASRPPAPARDGLPVPQGQSLPSIVAGSDSAATMMTKALERSEGAIDRLSLSQFASLPAASDASQGVPTNRWFTELPLALDGRTAVLPLEIEEDNGGGTGMADPQAKLWRVRFALDVEPIGPLHAMVTMQGRTIGVTVWAEREATSQLVRDHAPDLKAALLDNDFDNPQIEVLAGQPLKRAAHAGHYLDRRS